MKFNEFYICDSNGNSNCVVRSFCKLFNKGYNEQKEELINLTKEIGRNNYNDTEVFESYLSSKGYTSEEMNNDMKVKNLSLSNGKYAILCWDKKDYYHMVPIIDDVIYDKNNECLELYVLKIYKLRN